MPYWDILDMRCFYCIDICEVIKNIIMAKQVGLLKLEGRIGDLSFYKDNRGYHVRMRQGPTKEQINNDPRFLRTKENGLEFGRAARAAKLLRTKLRLVLKQGSDPQFCNRLTSRIHRVLKADTFNKRGERLVLPENLGMLVGMDCNLKAPFSEVFFVNQRPSYDRATGVGRFEIPAMLVKNKVAGLEGATNVQIQLIAAEFDPQNPEADLFGLAQSTFMDISKADSTPAEVLQIDLLPQSTSAVVILMGISYFQKVNGVYCSLANGLYNALSIVELDIP